MEKKASKDTKKKEDVVREMGQSMSKVKRDEEKTEVAKKEIVVKPFVKDNERQDSQNKDEIHFRR